MGNMWWCVGGDGRFKEGWMCVLWIIFFCWKDGDEFWCKFDIEELIFFDMREFGKFVDLSRWFRGSVGVVMWII